MTTPSTNVLIKFNGYKVFNILLKVEPDYVDDKSELEIKLEIKNTFTSNSEFNISLIIDLNSKDKKFSLNFETIGYFSTSEDMSDEFKTSPFFTINAPAIVFPYIRAVTSMITSNAGHNVVILPTYNFAGAKPAEKKE